jgi:hypothetical protein
MTELSEGLRNALAIGTSVAKVDPEVRAVRWDWVLGNIRFRNCLQGVPPFLMIASVTSSFLQIGTVLGTSLARPLTSF